MFKILKLYCIWSLIYFPLSFRQILVSEESVLWGILIYIRNFFFVGSYTQLWYLNATVFAVIILSYLVYKRIKIRLIMFIAISLYSMGLLLDQSWFGILLPLKETFPEVWMLLKMGKKLIVTTRNGIFEGVLFVGIGMLFAWKKISMDIKKAVISFFVSICMLLGEVAFVTHFKLIKGYDMYIFLVPVTFFCFI